MNQSTISPGWALTAIVILWGLAGALAQPLDEGPSEQHEPSAETWTSGPYPTVQLLCVRDDETPSTNRPSSAQGKVHRGLVRYALPTGDVPRGTDHVASPVLRCHVLN
jgi:hypothetical protein